MILAGDIGGTNTRLALFKKDEHGFVSIAEEKFSSQAFDDLSEIVQIFLADKHCEVEQACFGVAGPIEGEIVDITNLSWNINANHVKQLFGHDQVSLINDLEANAYGLRELKEEDFVVLNEGEANPTGNGAILSAGTGLGEAGLYFDAQTNSLRPFATEGGHTDFAPRNDLEIELFRFLLVKFGRVSSERIISGTGLVNIYEFLRDTKREIEPAWLAEEIKSSDAGAIISEAAMNQRAAICEKTLEIFVYLYGAEAGNLGLKMKATGGVFVGGGIAPKILSKLQEPNFLESFLNKGRMRPLLEKMPLRVVLNDKAALLGAAHFAFYKQ
jgi:glucokinase